MTASRVDTEQLLAAIDERTAFVNISHVLFKSAYVHDVAAIAERARAVGALTIVDGYQSVGTHPGGRGRAGRGRLHRRLPEVAVRRAGRGLPVGEPAGGAS